KACRGGCPKHRFRKSPPGEPGLHYLCEGYKKFFLHIRKYLNAIATLLENGLPASRIMEAIDAPLLIRRGEKQ
ncbi:MAG: anaerobic sulfatase maturase, partial [Desulfobacterota bacterium]|nr:anaerobic sulfatase maturase [Thermodesulfobacteriota bacterium]